MKKGRLKSAGPSSCTYLSGIKSIHLSPPTEVINILTEKIKGSNLHFTFVNNLKQRPHSAPSTFSRCGTICFFLDMTPFNSYRCGSTWGYPITWANSFFPSTRNRVVSL